LTCFGASKNEVEPSAQNLHLAALVPVLPLLSQPSQVRLSSRLLETLGNEGVRNSSTHNVLGGEETSSQEEIIKQSERGNRFSQILTHAKSRSNIHEASEYLRVKVDITTCCPQLQANRLCKRAR
jgi:hypothetical protein